MKKSIFCTLVLIAVMMMAAITTMAQDNLGNKYVVKIKNDHDVQLTCNGNTLMLSLENSGVFSDGDVIFVSKPAKNGSKKTDKVYTDTKGQQYPIWKSVNNKYYYVKTSAKTGKDYKVYVAIP